MAKTREYPTREALFKEFHYDDVSGNIYRKDLDGNVRSKYPAGWKETTGYIRISFGTRKLFAHRIGWILATGGIHTDNIIDHINGDKADNRLSNLRLANKSDNGANSKLRSDNTSGFKGVCFHKQRNKWVAHIMKNGKSESLGLHATAELAHAAYCEAAALHHGEFARTH